jgi:hypothetical protein
MGNFGPPSVSYRYLRIGKRGWLLKYISDHPWASNCGDVKIEIVRELEQSRNQSLRFPLYALDMIEVIPDLTRWGLRRPQHLRRPQRYFFDLNLSPQISGTGVEDRLKPDVAVKLIIEAIEHFGLPDY